MFLKENIPVQHRTSASILRYMLSLLSETPLVTDALNPRIQNITFPPHHQDRPGDQPTCKGFALIVLGSDQDAEFLLSRWPWDRSGKKSDSQEEHTRPDVQDGIKFGFRTLSKTRWDELKEEYLAYRQRLVDEINAYEDTETFVSAPPPSSSRSTTQPTLQSLQREHDIPPTPEDTLKEAISPAPAISASSWYPPDSLVFVRNIHPGTNKTTLRKLFAAAIANGELQDDGLDYVDFNKGMDSVSFIVSSPPLAHCNIILTDYFCSVISDWLHQNTHRSLWTISPAILSYIPKGSMKLAPLVTSGLVRLLWN